MKLVQSSTKPVQTKNDKIENLAIKYIECKYIWLKPMIPNSEWELNNTRKYNILAYKVIKAIRR